MGKPIYITDPAVAAHYHVHTGEWAWIADNAEAAWLVLTHHGYSIDGPSAPPAAFYVHPDAPLPFVPYPGAAAPTPPAPSPTPSPTPPAPAPQATQLGIGPEDQHIKIDVDGDGTPDVHVIVDKPPQNTP